MTGPATTGGE